MMQAPLVTVVVPCYNQASFLDECLQSILDQSYPSWECILVNDGSGDNTEEICLKWAARDTRIVYLPKENGGLSSARNAGIEVAKGEWILPLDADDKISNDYLSLAVDEFAKGYTVIYSEAEYFGEKTGKWELKPFSLRDMAVENMIFCSSFFKKQDWVRVNGYDETLKYGLEDWEFWIAILKDGGQVYKIDKVCFYYRQKEVSMLRDFALSQSRKDYTIRVVYRKHLDFFIDQLGFYHDWIKMAESTRYKLGDKILSLYIFDKLIPDNMKKKIVSGLAKLKKAFGR